MSPENQNARPGKPGTGSSGEHSKTKGPTSPAQDGFQMENVLVTRYRDARDTKGETRTLAKCLDLIRKNSVIAERIAELRPLYWKAEELRPFKDDSTEAKAAYESAEKKYKAAKTELPAVTFSGTFTKRGIAGLKTYSGILVADLDHLKAKGFDIGELKSRVSLDPHVLFCFVSPGGDGLKIGIRVTSGPENHTEAFLGMQRYFEANYGIRPDDACKDICRLCFLSHDPEVFVNANAAPFDWQAWPAPATKVIEKGGAGSNGSKENKPDKAAVAAMLAVVPPCPEYPVWLRIIAAVGDALDDDDAVEVLSEWSPERERGEYLKKLHSGMERVHIGTLIHLAKENGWTPPAPEPPFDAYYEINRRVYLACNAGGRWLPFEEGQFKKRLRKAGIRAKAHEGENLSPSDETLLWLQDHRDVNYAAPLAGRMSGFYEDNGARYLVTTSPHFIVPEKGEWPTLRALLENLFVRGEPEHGERQWHTVLTWLKGSVEALRAGMTKEAQALALPGPPQSGKSLFQRLISHLLGGRECKPFLFMSGKTPFNAELFEAEHLALEDEHMSRHLRDRLALGAAIKGIVANEAHCCHRKNCTPVTLRPFWRLTLTLNDEPEALLVLPPLDEHVADKILLLRASRFPLPMPTTTKDERAAFWKCLIGELPAFLHFLLHEYQVPDGFTDARYVVTGWHHPDLTAALHDLSPAASLLALIDQLAPWGEGKSEWEGSADELRAQLFQHYDTAPDARRLLEWPQACGNYLATLAKKSPARVQQHRTNTARLWIIRKP